MAQPIDTVKVEEKIMKEMGPTFEMHIESVVATHPYPKLGWGETIRTLAP